ncbi:outer membrane protein assembly factor BamE [Frigidibacter sp. ROC022]|uniref:outer membrane protein assembly factor BamE n=1 Tax=Frigidibacter sp. ROC022 TaxID=2971796 RepID=UPI00215AF928|nr:outer membrane protein assembly factor BamE [Frigidibacter sp. ROC022]MCR8723247.1 outer membrane protein assembly factor BamE [Frigidibacter sp. ROC022]
MTAISRRLRLGLAALLLLSLAACTATYRNHGWAPSDDDLAQITVGTDTRETVSQAIGAPGTSGLLADGGWYYVQSRYEHYAYRAPKEIDRQVVAISFDDKGVVENIERFGLEKGRVIALSRRVTDDNVKGVSFLRQLFGSLGRLNAGDLLQQR